jgi:hypothetical protein
MDYSNLNTKTCIEDEINEISEMTEGGRELRRMITSGERLIIRFTKHVLK